MPNQLCLNDFKTSHVKVYHLREVTQDPFISDFKTSHVKVYRYSDRSKQYVRRISKHLMLKFILIVQIVLHMLIVHFKTSHVKVYRFLIGALLVLQRYFKTSHVKVYHTPFHIAEVPTLISKHLMLKFIGDYA